MSTTYVSLVLLILAVLISYPATKGAPDATVSHVHAQILEQPLEYKNAFDQDDNLKPEIMQMLQSVLTAHDVNLSASLTLNSNDRSPSALSRAINMHNALLAIGLPQEAIRVKLIYSDQESSGDQLLSLNLSR